ncbi:hypothetical protein SELMODRAFT_583, partial [Selaginella moellendorffii]
LLRQCSRSKDLARGRQIHASIARSSAPQDPVVGNWLIQMYLKCGSLIDASQVFYQLLETSVVNLVAWTALIAAYARNGQTKLAIRLFQQMQLEGNSPDRITLVTIFEACGNPENLEDGKKIHAYLSCNSDVVLGSSLITMYGKCGSLSEACLMFQSMEEWNTVAWNSLMGAFVQHDRVEAAMELYWEMLQCGFLPSRPTFLTVLAAISSLESLRHGKLVHDTLVEAGHEDDVVVQTALVNMYGKCGSVVEAVEVFDRMPRHDVILWSAVISAHVNCAEYEESLRLFRKMQLEGNRPNNVTLVSVLSACEGPQALETGKGIHECVVEAGYEGDLIVGNAIVSMYGKCGSLEDAWDVFHRVPRRNGVPIGNALISMYGRCGSFGKARDLFDSMAERDAVTWNTMMSVSEQLEHGRDSIQLFRQMLQEGTPPDKVTILTVLNVCASLPALQEGKAICAWLDHTPLSANQMIGNAILNMYAKCGSRDEARRIFSVMQGRDAVSWNALIGAYGSYSRGRYAFQIFQAMQLEGSTPDAVTFTTILSVCSHGGLLGEAVKWFRWMREDYYVEAETGHYGCIVDLLGRLGRVPEAEEVAEKMPAGTDPIVWTTLLSACQVHGETQRGKRAAERLVELDPEVTSAYVVLSTIY